MSVQDKIDAQRELCSEKNIPFFAPTKTCYHCCGFIWEKISLERAKNKLITTCPICNYSFVN